MKKPSGRVEMIQAHAATKRTAKCPCGYEWKLRNSQPSRCPVCANTSGIAVDGVVQSRRRA